MLLAYVKEEFFESKMNGNISIRMLILLKNRLAYSSSKMFISKKSIVVEYIHANFGIT